jgi:acylphosphatase
MDKGFMIKKITLFGRVQGVGCRGYAISYARKLGLSGAVSNMRDGSVRIIIEAEDVGEVRLYVYYLITNPYKFYFHGRIERYTIEDYSGPIRGDYSF